jgi:hypothetical protein
MSYFKYAVDYQCLDGDLEWEQDCRFGTLEEAVEYATAEALKTTNINHRVVKLERETITTLPPLEGK